MANDRARSPTPGIPVYPNARHFLRTIEGVPYPLYRSTYNAIWAQRGSPQEQADWTDPDAWISERLEGEEERLALRIWQKSKHELNPRYLRGSWYLASKHVLLSRDEQDTLRITERGEQFLAEAEGTIVAEIDGYEGILNLLKLVADRGPGRRSDFLPGYTDYCRAFTTYRSENVIKGSLYDRLVNLIDREYVVRRGQNYEVTDIGLAYLEQYAHLIPGRVVGSKHAELQRRGRELTQEAREQLSEFLSSMDPFKFEALIQLLLEEMGYTSVNVTSPVNDKGVDVVANIELGISSVREVVQVKRHKGNISRPVLDQLRGSLHRFDAVRGTIITAGGFSRGTVQAAFERGAAPITLIDGEKLLDLLIEYEIGVTKNSVEYIEFDAAKLAQFEVDEAEEPET
jgi:restriction system protein